jgi:hypothetical protein
LSIEVLTIEVAVEVARVRARSRALPGLTADSAWTGLDPGVAIALVG